MLDADAVLAGSATDRPGMTTSRILPPVGSALRAHRLELLPILRVDLLPLRHGVAHPPWPLADVGAGVGRLDALADFLLGRRLGCRGSRRRATQERRECHRQHVRWALGERLGEHPVDRQRALRLDIDSWRWDGVPFFIRAGKCLAGCGFVGGPWGRDEAG